MQKKHLIIVHSYPTNSIILKGLYNFLGKYFVVHAIDLPGFHPNTKALDRVTIHGFVEYVEQRILSLGLDSYVICGISFGFCIINQCKNLDHCRGIIAITPYINTNYLGLSIPNKLFLKSFAYLVSLLHVETFVLTNTFFQNILVGTSNKDTMKLISDTIDHRTFFQMGNLVLSYYDSPRLQSLPYIILLSRKDVIIGEKTIEYFIQSKQKLIIDIDIDHFPDDLSEKYFSNIISKSTIIRINDFLQL